MKSSLRNNSLSYSCDLTLRFLISFEIALIFIASFFVSVIRLNESIFNTLTEYPGFPKIFIYPLTWYFLLYKTKSWDRSILVSSNDYYIRIIKAGAYSYLLFAAYAYSTKFPISRLWILWNVALVTGLLLIVRFLVRFLVFRTKNIFEEQVYLYVGKPEAKQIAIRDFQSAFGFSPVVIVMKPPSNESSDEWLIKYENLVTQHNAYGTIIGVGEIQDAALLRRLADSRRNQIVDLLLATRIGAITSRFERLESPILVRIGESTLFSGGFVVKRIFDILFSLFALVALSPVFIAVAIMVKATSKGPIFYIDERVGKNGKTFKMPKFRSMYVGSDLHRLSTLGRPAEDMFDRYKNDPRITPFGRFIRRWSLDEIPQFVSVLLGTMSVVGPRPVLPEEMEQIDSSYQIRFMAKPGLTGLWQVTGRKEVPWQDRMLRDITYIDNWNFAFDLVLIAKTIVAILKGNGAV